MLMCKHNANSLSTFFALLIAYVDIITYLLQFAKKINFFIFFSFYSYILEIKFEILRFLYYNGKNMVLEVGIHGLVSR